MGDALKGTVVEGAIHAVRGGVRMNTNYAGGESEV